MPVAHMNAPSEPTFASGVTAYLFEVMSQAYLVVVAAHAHGIMTPSRIGYKTLALAPRVDAGGPFVTSYAMFRLSPVQAHMHATAPTAVTVDRTYGRTVHESYETLTVPPLEYRAATLVDEWRWRLCGLALHTKLSTCDDALSAVSAETNAVVAQYPKLGEYVLADASFSDTNKLQHDIANAGDDIDEWARLREQCQRWRTARETSAPCAYGCGYGGAYGGGYGCGYGGGYGGGYGKYDDRHGGTREHYTDRYANRKYYGYGDEIDNHMPGTPYTVHYPADTKRN